VFYLKLAYVLQWLFKCFQMFLQVFQKYVSSVSALFRRILQMFLLIVSKVDRVSLLETHMLQPAAPAARAPPIERAQTSVQGKQRGRERSPCGVERRAPCERVKWSASTGVLALPLPKER
jgi:hypothetical protein